MNLTDDNGRLAPSIVAGIIILAFILGNVTGWIGNMNWSLRANTAQIVEDMEAGTKYQKEKDAAADILKANIEEVRTNVLYTQEDCLNYSNVDYVRSLRNDRRDEE